MTRIRVRFSKLGKIRFTSHRDVARIWERTLRKARIEVAYSEGFSPRPKLSFGLALSNGHESLAEYLEIELATDEELTAEGALKIKEQLNITLPVGLEVQAIAVASRKDESLQQSVRSCTWRFDIDDLDISSAQDWVDSVLGAEEIVVERERKGKVVVEDLRQQILFIQVVEATDHGVRLLAELGTQPRALRPSEFLAVSDPPLKARYVCRMNQWMLQGDERVEPLSVNAGPAPFATLADVTRRESTNVRTNGRACSDRPNQPGVN